MEYSNINYDGIGWKDYPSTTTKLNAQNLNKVDDAIIRLVDAVKHIRTLLGEYDLTDRQDAIIPAINDITGKFGGYYGYNLLDMSLLKKTSNGHIINMSLDDVGLKAGESCTFSMEADNDIYLYEYNSAGEMIVTETLYDTDKSTAFTINSQCKSIAVFFPSAYYATESACQNANVMLEKGTEKHSYEPYTGREEMTDIWSEILENRLMIRQQENDIISLDSVVKQQIYTFNDISVETSAWVADETYTDYPYRASITCSGITGDYIPYISFSVADISKGIFAPVAYTGTGVCYIYANTVPDAPITIPTIQFIKKEA